jgi:hypothetical protein
MFRSVIAKNGNNVINAELEYHVPSDLPKPRKCVSRGEDRKDWVKRKYLVRQFDASKGGEAQKAVGADQAKLLRSSESFAAGRELMVGVLDLTVLEVKNLPKFLFKSLNLSGGFALKIVLGRFHGKTMHSISGRKWLGHKIHLSWDGHSPLEISLLMGAKAVGNKAVHQLNELRKGGNKSFSFSVDLLESVGESQRSVDTTVVFRLEFIDLRS